MNKKEKEFEILGPQAILHVREKICTSIRELLQSPVFEIMVEHYWRMLFSRQSPLCAPFREQCKGPDDSAKIVELLRVLSGIPLDQAAGMLPWAAHLTEPANPRLLHEFVEGFYNFWRSYDRYMILHSEPGPSSLDQRPYRAFNETLENLNHIVRALYRDICENITGDHPRIYRQVSAGCDVGLIATAKTGVLPPPYAAVLDNIPFIRQAMINPPLIIDPPMNKRTGQFQKIEEDPLAGARIERERYLCFPLQVGPLTIFVYFHNLFMGLGCALSNLFEVANDEQVANGPDAIYLFGQPAEQLERFGQLPTVFYDDPQSGLLVASVPAEERFAYFGYLKKMILTLHNIIMMKRGRMPYHGAMVRLVLRGDKTATFLIIGDTATGKSESLEALRLVGRDSIEEIRIIADDMGSLEIDTAGCLVGYGTEIGAFVRLDDLQQGYAFEQMDRAIFMSPHRTNARVVLPVTTLEDILEGHRVDYMLYANNYEQVDDYHPLIHRFHNPSEALTVFREGAAMAKGTTTTTGLGHSYFANIFGPPQYRDLHDGLAESIFKQAFKSGTFVGQVRTRLGIEGYETTGPQEVARALLKLFEHEAS